MASFDRSYTEALEKEVERFNKEFEKQISALVTDSYGQNAEQALDIIEEESQKLVPEDTGRTRDSFYRRVEFNENSMELVFGYDENNQIPYLPFIYVNGYLAEGGGEGPRDVSVFRKEGAEPYWLDKAVLRNKDKIVNKLSKG